MWVPYITAPDLMIAEMWKDTFESEGLSCRILPDGDPRSWGELVPFVIYLPKGREHIAEEILRKL
mgnify:CR=1 FL=1